MKLFSSVTVTGLRDPVGGRRAARQAGVFARPAITKGDPKMNHKMTLLACAAVGAMLTALPATAAPILFQLTGGKTASFTIDSATVPDFLSLGTFGNQISYNNVAGTFGGISGVGAIGFGTNIFAQLNIGGTPLGFTQYGGPDLFTIVGNKPIFNFGTFNLGSITSGAAQITISAGAVPEPATWTMMFLGFAAVGFAMRRRQKITARVTYG